MAAGPVNGICAASDQKKQANFWASIDAHWMPAQFADVLSRPTLQLTERKRIVAGRTISRRAIRGRVSPCQLLAATVTAQAILCLSKMWPC
jgi:hypothetical protein